MKRSQRAVAQGWAATDKKRKDDNRQKEMESKEVSPEEHKRRLEALKKLGIISKD